MIGASLVFKVGQMLDSDLWARVGLAYRPLPAAASGGGRMHG